MMRIAHYVRSSHWDREWYDPMQGFRMRLVGVLDEVLDILAAQPAFHYTMDGQSVPIRDYLEVRPEREQAIRRYAKEERLKIGPWYVAPDEWLVSGESLVRNLELGIEEAREYGGTGCRAGLLCDQFGHIGQMPQIFEQFGIPMAYAWRGTSERKLGGHFLWQGPDGTVIPTYRFGRRGYGMLAYSVRNVFADQGPFDPPEAVDRLVDYARLEAARSQLSPIMLYDGSDHMEIEPRMNETIALANKKLAEDGIQIIESDLEAYQSAVIRERTTIEREVIGELRETSGDLTEGRPDGGDEQWLIAGTYASRVHLKQSNAACEDELCLWAEPFCTFAAESLGIEYPQSLLKSSWRHLLENHPHDSMCGCSTDQVHADMIYRFDQSIAISSRLAENAMREITIAACDSAMRPAVGLFNATAHPIEEPVDFDIYLPNSWPTTFAEFFGFEQKFGFRLRGPDGEEIPYQIVSQQRDVKWRQSTRYKLSAEGRHHRVSVCARVAVPAFGYTTLGVEPMEGPTRYRGSLAGSHRSIETEFVRLMVNDNGTIGVKDKRNGAFYDQLLTIEERADIGDGWFHGIALNDQIFTSSAASADVALISDGRFRSTLRISLTLNVPEEFDFRAMRRSERRRPLSIVSDVTVRDGSDRIEVSTVVQNDVLDHRIRMLFPTGLKVDYFETDSAFDVVRRAIKLPIDNDQRRELDLETRPQASWTAVGDGKSGLAIIGRGLCEVAVIDNADRAIALTLLRGFRRVISRDDDRGGQVLAKHTFRYDLVPFAGEMPMGKLFLYGQRLHSVVRQVSLPPSLYVFASPIAPRLPRLHSFAHVDGDVVVTSVRQKEDRRETRMFNPNRHAAQVSVPGARRAVRLDGNPDERQRIRGCKMVIQPAQIVTLVGGETRQK